MDVLYFLKNRTRLIRQYYECAAHPFDEIVRKIEAEEEPYIPPYSEDPEPPFLSEWIEADELREITGRCCISMLAASLQLYFKTWERDLGMVCTDRYRAISKKDGWVAGYRACFGECVGIIWSQCPANLAIIDQVVLARNRDQHPENITSLRVAHAEKDWKRFPPPFFLDEREAKLFQDADEPSWLVMPTLHVSRDKVMAAIGQVELLCEWLEEKLFDAKYPKRVPQE